MCAIKKKVKEMSDAITEILKKIKKNKNPQDTHVRVKKAETWQRVV